MAGRLRNALTHPDPVGYVDNYQDRMVDGEDLAIPGGRGLHPSVRQDMDPAVATMARSQEMRGRRSPQGGSDLQAEQELEQMAKAAGFDLQGAVDRGADPRQALEAAMQRVWKQSPTDGVGEMIDLLSKKYRVTPPWEMERRGRGERGPKPPQEAGEPATAETDEAMMPNAERMGSGNAMLRGKPRNY